MTLFTPRVVRRQLAQLASETQQPQTADPLTWWRQIEARFYGVKRLARNILQFLKYQRRLNVCFLLLEISVVDGVPAYHLDALVFLNANGDLIRE